MDQLNENKKHVAIRMNLGDIDYPHFADLQRGLNYEIFLHPNMRFVDGNSLDESEYYLDFILESSYTYDEERIHSRFISNEEFEAIRKHFEEFIEISDKDELRYVEVVYAPSSEMPICFSNDVLFDFRKKYSKFESETKGL